MSVRVMEIYDFRDLQTFDRRSDAQETIAQLRQLEAEVIATAADVDSEANLGKL